MCPPAGGNGGQSPPRHHVQGEGTRACADRNSDSAGASVRPRCSHPAHDTCPAPPAATDAGPVSVPHPMGERAFPERPRGSPAATGIDRESAAARRSGSDRTPGNAYWSGGHSRARDGTPGSRRACATGPDGCSPCTGRQPDTRRVLSKRRQRRHDIARTALRGGADEGTRTLDLLHGKQTL